MKESFFNKSNSIRTLSLIGALMLGLSLMSTNSFADDDSGDDRGKRCDKQGHEGKRDHGPHERDLSNVLNMLDKKLDLTEEQKTSISQVIDQYNPQLKQLQEKMRDGRKAERNLIKQDNFDESAVRKQAEQNANLMVEMMVLKAKAKHAIHSNLTDEQRDEIEEMFEKRYRERMKDKAENNV